MHKIFESQLDNEKIYLVLREHPTLVLIRLGLIVFLAIVGIAAQILIPDLLPFEISSAAQKLLTLMFSVYYLGLVVSALLVFLYYYLSLQIITNMRMVDVDQHGLFGRKVTEIQIENVEEVTSHAKGLLATVLGFGNVLVQTSGSMAEFEFNHVAHPEHVKKLILDIYEQRRRAHPEQTHPPHPVGK